RLGYPDREQELSMMHAHHVIPPLPAPLFSAAQLVETQALVERVQVSEPLMRYALSLVRATRRHPQLELGASPRAGLALLRASKARAVLQGRDFATPEDVRALAIPVLGHRLRLSYEAENRGVTPESIVHRLIQDLDLI
ncbi:MoxR family ATPase, partial [Myxococcota bacterium]|nr:MoxR family ATPase [Myxococcota bacterium]